MEKIFVTGADGMLGGNLVRELIKRNYSVKVLLQKSRKVNTLDGLDIEVVYGDLLDKNSMDNAIAGCDYIIHTAANTSVWPVRSEMIRRINIEGTQNIIDLSIKHQIKRNIFVGTASSFGFGSKENPGVEGNPFLGDQYKLDYIDSKYEAYQLLLKAIKNGLPAISVHPTFMLGPFDSGPSSNALIIGIYKKQVPGYTSGGRNYICVKDVAVGIANALSMGRIGESYILGNQNLNYKEAFELIAKELKVTPPKNKVPDAIILLYGAVSSFLGKLFKFKPPVSYNLAKIACDEHYFSAQKAVNELNLPQTPIENGVKDAIEWFQENHYI